MEKLCTFRVRNCDGKASQRGLVAQFEPVQIHEVRVRDRQNRELWITRMTREQINQKLETREGD